MNNEDLKFSEMSESQLRGYIRLNGVDNDSPKELLRIVNQMVKEKFNNMRVMPCIETAQGVIYFQYNETDNMVEVGTATNAGLSVHHKFDYDHNYSFDENLQNVVEKVCEIYGDLDESEEIQIENSRGIGR